MEPAVCRLLNADFLLNYEKLESDGSYVPTCDGQTLIYPLVGCGEIDRIDWWTEFYVGCSHGCVYCFVRLEALRHGDIADKGDWVCPVLKYPRSEIVKVFRRELEKVKAEENILHSMTTDPFMSKESADLHLEIAEIVTGCGAKNRFLTKGTYPPKIQVGHADQFGVSVTNLPEDLQRRFEPFAASKADRIQSLKRLSDRGCFTFANITCFPFCSSRSDIMELLGSISFVDEVSFHGLYYYGHPTEKELDYYFRMSSLAWKFCKENGKRFYTTGHLNPYVRKKFRKVY